MPVGQSASEHELAVARRLSDNEIVEALRERDRLRAALERIAATEPTRTYGREWEWVHWRRQAREALDG